MFNGIANAIFGQNGEPIEPEVTVESTIVEIEPVLTKDEVNK